MPTHSPSRYWQALAVSLSLSAAALAGPGRAADSPKSRLSDSLARRALMTNKDESAKAVGELRAMGPDGLRAFLDTNSADIEAAVNTRGRLANAGTPAQTNQVLSALDSICQQKDCYASKLYWYTDLEQAKSAARAQGKPILSLRLLGRLDEDLSCANSRFFRVTLYANEQVSQILRDRFILHWQSVRPAPKLTIDFGDGRKMERTLTGNSIHYVLDSDGQVIDALPGLYGPGAFLRELDRIASTAATLRALQTSEERQTSLRKYHEMRLTELENAWLNDIKRAGLRVAPSREIPRPALPGSPSPSAQRAAAAAVSKAVMVERPVIRGMSGNPKPLDSIGSDPGWSMIAGLHAQDATLDRTTRALMTFKDPSLTGMALQAAVAALERSVAEDTVRNEYVLRARIHGWLASGAASSEVMNLNDKIYAELFLTPSWDAWLGLRPVGAYSGIDNDGVLK